MAHFGDTACQADSIDNFGRSNTQHTPADVVCALSEKLLNSACSQPRRMQGYYYCILTTKRGDVVYTRADEKYEIGGTSYMRLAAAADPPECCRWQWRQSLRFSLRSHLNTRCGHAWWLLSSWRAQSTLFTSVPWEDRMHFKGGRACSC